MPPVKASDYVVQYLAAQGVTHVYELCGGMIAHLLDSVARQDRLRTVSMHHEQAAAFAAEGHARMTGIPAVALATSGPGATNLLTAIGSCYFDSIPAVFITGQVNRHELKGERLVRQLGFQETDIVSMARPITKRAVQVAAVEDLPAELDAAFSAALSGRPGPALLDLPMDVQRLALTPPGPPLPAPRAAQARPAGLETAAAEVAAALAGAQRPLVLVGGGVRASGATAACRAALERLGLPVVQSLLGLDVLGHDHPLRVGMIGSYGNRWANHALGQCDVLLVLGSRLDIRQTGADTAGFGRRRIFHVDVDGAEINNRVTGVQAVVADLADFCQALRAAPWPAPDVSGWAAELQALRARWPDTRELQGLPGLNPNAFLQALGRASGAACAFAVDVGQHQMWAAQSLPFTSGQRFLTSGGMGAMGFALPAGVGAAIACPGQPVVVVSGDGSIQLNIQELQTIAARRLPVKIVVLNNRSLGMVRQFQESYFESRFQSTVVGYDAPDFVRVAEAYGLAARRLDATGLSEPQQGAAIDEALAWLWSEPQRPMLLDVAVPLEANVYPKLAFGRPITEMEPFAKPVDMEGT